MTKPSLASAALPEEELEEFIVWKILLQEGIITYPTEKQTKTNQNHKQNNWTKTNKQNQKKPHPQTQQKQKVSQNLLALRVFILEHSQLQLVPRLCV